ncbi:MAG: DUF5660 domain-containing protein [Candidatus Shapirobacteria bacterium]|jgi:hypothetical protein|nr:DUF5660 domain-containing protein [Candidatus Shapirobacteria bacterium]
MAGGNSFIKNPQKGKYNPAFNSAEIYKPQDNSTVTVSSILNGVLRPGETIDFSQEIKNPDKPKIDNYIQREQAVFINEHKQDDRNEIIKIENEIKNLRPITENLSSDIINASLNTTPESNTYQLGWFQRAKNIILNQKKVNDSDLWIETYNHRKNKKNAFWNKAKSKNGGEKYLNSSEHAVARSAN